MGLSDITMTLDEARAVAAAVAKARIKYGKHGAAPVRPDQAQEALVLLLDQIGRGADPEELAAVKAENVKLKQRISGYETAAKRKRNVTKSEK